MPLKLSKDDYKLSDFKLNTSSRVIQGHSSRNAELSACHVHPLLSLSRHAGSAGLEILQPAEIQTSIKYMYHKTKDA